MSKKSTVFAIFALLILFGPAAVSAQQPTGQLLKRSSIKTETYDLSHGGRVTLLGAPVGSITIEGWNQNTVEITAEIEIQAPTEQDLDRIAMVTGFGVTEELNAIGIVTTGTHDKNFIKKNAKNFPKTLFGLPWSVNFHLRVPQLCELDINGGKGNLTMTGVEGPMLLKSQTGDAELNLTGGDVIIVFGSGKVTVNIPSRGWRGRGAEIQVLTGTLTVNLPPSFNAYINADVLRIGKIENTYAGLKKRERTTPTEKSFTGRAGTGGATLNLKVGDGILRIAEQAKP